MWCDACGERLATAVVLRRRSPDGGTPRWTWRPLCPWCDVTEIKAAAADRGGCGGGGGGAL
jgi:hypothetical protein